jgi:low temperature requirement protein LtrA
LVPRRTDEEHRTSTPLELLFDLCFVVAVSQAASQLSSHLALGDIRSGLVGYGTVFFAIWWAWVNFTWFASAYDRDDVAYRLLTFVQIVGVLILAAGIPSAFAHGNFDVMTVGYVVMRVAMVTQWLRAAAGHAAGRTMARTYALGITILQVGWVARLFFPSPWATVAFYVLALGEMSVPAWSERGGSGTPWHPEHISERYGLFTLIVLGECVAAATVAIQSASTSNGSLSASLIGVAAGGLLLVFAAWWWYFEHPADDDLRVTRQFSFVWGYAHYLVFASLAALGAGLEVAADATRRHSEISALTAGLAVAGPVAAYLLVTGALQARSSRSTSPPFRSAILAALLILGLGFATPALRVGVTVPLMGVVAVALVVVDHVVRPGPSPV